MSRRDEIIAGIDRMFGPPYVDVWCDYGGVFIPGELVPDDDEMFQDIYITGDGTVLGNTHDPVLCEGRPCVIHHPSDHHMSSWPTHYRSDRGIMERICPHGVGHPDPDDLAWRASEPEINERTGGGVHGCDLCCIPPTDVAKCDTVPASTD